MNKSLCNMFSNVKNGKYEIKLSRPQKPEGYKRDNYVYDEEKSVRWNREHREQLELEYKNKLQTFFDEANRLEGVFIQDLKDELVNEYGLSKNQADLIFERAWDESHSDGLDSVISTAEDLADFVIDILKG